MSRRRFDPSSLVAALLFAGIASRYLVEGFSGREVSFPWAMPGVLAAIVLVIVLRLVTRSRRDER